MDAVGRTRSCRPCALTQSAALCCHHYFEWRKYMHGAREIKCFVFDVICHFLSFFRLIYRCVYDSYSANACCCCCCCVDFHLADSDCVTSNLSSCVPRQKRWRLIASINIFINLFESDSPLYFDLERFISGASKSWPYLKQQVNTHSINQYRLDAWLDCWPEKSTWKLTK